MRPAGAAVSLVGLYPLLCLVLLASVDQSLILALMWLYRSVILSYKLSRVLLKDYVKAY